MNNVINFPEQEPDSCDCDGPLKMVGYDDCIMGTVDRFGFDHEVYLYDVSKVISKLVSEDGMDEDEANEFFEFNMKGSWVGPGTPVYFYPKEDA